jgi:hypothetical protein
MAIFVLNLIMSFFRLFFITWYVRNNQKKSCMSWDPASKKIELAHEGINTILKGKIVGEKRQRHSCRKRVLLHRLE